jgi:hypothetical protein
LPPPIPEGDFWPDDEDDDYSDGEDEEEDK